MIDPKSPSTQMSLFSDSGEKQLIRFRVKDKHGSTIHEAILNFRNRSEVMPTLERFSNVLSEGGEISLFPYIPS